MRNGKLDPTALLHVIGVLLWRFIFVGGGGGGGGGRRGGRSLKRCKLGDGLYPLAVYEVFSSVLFLVTLVSGSELKLPFGGIQVEL